MNKKLLLVTGAIMLTFSGCATILDGTTQKISINSNPSDLKVKVGEQTVVTPAVITVKRENKDKIINVSGKCNKTIMLNKKLNPTFFVNILSGGAFGSTTDYVSGAMWKYDDNININCN